MGGSAADWVDHLVRMGEDLEAPAFLLPTQDGLVAEVSRRRAELAAMYRFQLPPDETVQLFLDKTRFHEWAQGHSLPLPESRIVSDYAELRRSLDEMPYPLVVKPLYRTPEWSRVSPVQKVLRFTSRRDLDDVTFDLFAVAPTYIVSQWIPGPDSQIHYCLAYCDPPGELRAWYTGRKLLQYPRQTGSTAICVGVEDEELVDLTRRVFARAGMHGLGSLEVKYGPDGRPYIMEPTVGRPNLQSFSAVASGCNLQALAMAGALERKGRIDAVGVRNAWWVEESAVRELASEGGGDPVPWRLLAQQLIKARRVAGAYWSWSDPVPWLSLMRETFQQALRRLFRKGAR